MKSHTAPAPATSSATFSKNYNIRTFDRSKISNISNDESHEGRLMEAIYLAALLRELIAPIWKKRPEFPGSENILIPFDSGLLEEDARQGLSFVVCRVESVLKECQQAMYEQDKEEVSK